jgi:hypothetical protein
MERQLQLTVMHIQNTVPQAAITANTLPGLRAASLSGLNCFELRPLLLAVPGVSTAMLAASIDATSAMLLRPSLLQVLQLLRNFSPSCTQRRHAAISRSAPAGG